MFILALSSRPSCVFSSWTTKENSELDRSKAEVDGWINLGRKVGRRKGRHRHRHIWEAGRALPLRVPVFFVK